MMHRPPAGAVAGALAIALMVSTPNPAEAQISGDLSGLAELGIFGGVVGGVAYLGFSSALIGLSIDRQINGHGLEMGWAVGELLFGAAHVAGGLVSLLALSWVGEASMAIGLPTLGVGVYHLAYAIYSLEEGGPPRRRGSSYENRVGALPTITPIEGGAEISLVGRF